MCLAMWLGFGPRLDLEESNNYNYVSAASIYKLRRVSKNINAKKNDFSSQECYLLKTITIIIIIMFQLLQFILFTFIN